MKKLPLTLLALALVLPSPSWATLGQSASLTAPAPRAMKASAAQPYTVAQVQTEYGLTVKEFVGANGQVFAVSWRGPVRPNLKALLGQYFDRLILASKPNAPVSIKQSDLVLSSGGHMGSFSGSAYLPSQVPEGVDVAMLLK